jgi:hypothetical protein
MGGNVAVHFELPAVCTLVVSLYTGFSKSYFRESVPALSGSAGGLLRVAQADALGDIVL